MSSRRRKYIFDDKEVGKSTWYRKFRKAKDNYRDSVGLVNFDEVGSSSSLVNHEIPSSSSLVNHKIPSVNINQSSPSDESTSLSDDIDIESSEGNCTSLLDDNNSSSDESLYTPLNDNVDQEELNNKSTFRERLRKWAIKNRVTRQEGNELLQELKNCNEADLKNLPKDLRTLIGNKPCDSKSSKQENVSFHYFGISKILNTTVGKLFNENCTTLKLSINVDGLPISKSSSNNFWPILGSINNSKKVFMIALFCGDGKPNDVNSFLNPFIKEVCDLCSNGINIKKKHYNFEFEKLIADAPAKSFLLNSKGSTGYSSCVRCRVVGEWAHNRVFFTNAEKAELRLNGDFDGEDDDFCQERSILFDIPNFDITCVPYDYMHSECLGIMKKLIEIWISNVKPLKRILSKSSIETLNDRLYIIRNFCPAEFARKPRFISEYNRWKATELRQFLFYTGPILLNDLLPMEYLNHFQLLSYLNRMMCTSHGINDDEKNYIEMQISNFILEFARLYDESLINHNVHSLTHLPTDALKYGSLDNFSAFIYENFMLVLKNMLRCGNSPMQQAINRYNEILSIDSTNELSSSTLSHPCKNNKSNDIQEFEQFKTTQLHFRSDRIADQFCKMNNGDFVLIDRIFKNKNSGQIYIEGSKFEKRKSAYKIPWHSKTVGVHKVSKLSTEKFEYQIENIAAKCYAIPNFSHEENISTKCYTIPDFLKKGKFFLTELLHHN